MKKKLLHFFAIFVALVVAIPIAKAQEYTFSSPTESWTQLGSSPEGDAPFNHSYLIGAASDEFVYTLPTPISADYMVLTYYTAGKMFGNGKFYQWSAGGTQGFEYDNTNSWVTATARYCLAGPGIASDDAGTLYAATVKTGNDFTSAKWSAPVGGITYWTNRPKENGEGGVTAGDKVGVKLSSVLSGRTDFFSANGDGVGGTGYLWFAPQNSQNVTRITISKKSFSAPQNFGGLPIANGSRSYVKEYSKGKLLYNPSLQSSSGNLYRGTYTEGDTDIAWEKLDLIVQCHGSSAFVLGGHEFIVYSKDSKTIAIYDYTTQTEFATFSPFSTESTQSYVSHSIDVKVNGNTANMYFFVPGVGAAKYTMTATPITAPVTNLQVQTSIASPYSAVVNWDAPTEGVPSKYAISYSIDGGSTWSTPVEETAKSHIYSNLAPGQYIFKVVPYFNGSPGEATTQSATVYGITAYVTNVNVAYNDNKGNSIVVSWDAPESEVAPDKYKVCYSTNGGTSWSTPIETPNLTYIFDNLAVGTYQFKVTPVFNGYAGEGVLSESINALAPTGHELIVTRKWTEGIAGTVDGAKNMAVSNDRVYLASPNYAALPYVGPNVKDKIDPTTGNWPNLSTDYAVGQVGFSMDNDDAGNIIVKTGNYFGSAATQFSIFPAGATTKVGEKKISVTGDYAPGGRADYIGAQGDLYNGTGYIWLIPQNAQKVVRITVVKGATSAITTWPLESNIASAEVIVRPLDSNRLYYHHQGDSYKIITLPEPNTTITSNLIENISVAGTPYNNLSSDMFTLQGNLLQVRNAGEGSQDISFCIANLSNNGQLLKYNDKTSITPFDGTTSSVSRVGSLVRAVKVDDYNYDIYSYSPGFGADCYRVTANPVFTITGAIQSLDYEYSSTETEEGIRQDVVLTWTAPENAFPTSYKIYRNGSFLKSVDGSTLTYTDKNINENYTYKVVPYFAGIAEDASLGLEVTTTEVETILYAPTISDVRNYDGYSIVEIFYKMPSLNKVKPAYYNIYRNGVLLETGMTQYNFIDDQLPKIGNDVKYTYTVEAVYGATYDNTTRTSQGTDVTVKARDWGLSGYQLQEIYNIPVSPAIGNLPNNFTNFEYYRQGHFYNGSWYIAQRADNLAKKDDPTYTNTSDKNTEIESAVDGTTGGVVAIKATNESDIFNGFTGKPITSEAFASVGLAIDDAGNIFMRHNNSNAGLAATAPTIDRITGLPINWLTYISDGFTRRITRGAIYKHKGDGTYETEPIVINLDPLWTSNDWINTMTFSYENNGAGDKNGQVTGRSDYYNMYGDVMSAEGGFLLISPSWTHCIFKVKVANGEYVNHETHDIKEYQSAEGQVNVKTGTENYGFRIDGRNAWVAQIRSNGYFGIHGEEDHAGEGEEAHEHTTHAIFVADSRINNTGGTSIVAFDNKSTEVNDGETFLITPASMYSRNYGDFIVTRGTKSSVGDAAADAKFMPPMPVAQMKQTDINDNIATNANGNWFHAEISTYTNTEGKDAECVDIYQYVPGVRFAKYRLIPDLSLPVVSPTLEITTAYSEGRTAITHFNGRSTWQRPGTFALTDPDNASVWIKSYSFELLDAKGNVVYSDEVPEAKDADGNIVIDYEFDYVVDKGIDNVDNCDLDFQTYTARIAVNYEFKNGEIQQSAYNYALDDNDYEAKAAESPAAFVFKQANAKIQVYEKDPNSTSDEDPWIIVDKYVDRYRVELDFNPADCDEPVSYYTIKALVNGKSQTIDIADFHLHQGAEVVNGIEQAKYVVASQIPGTYDFEAQKAPYYHKVGDDYGVGGQSREKSVLTWHHEVPVGYYTSGVAKASNDEEIVITDEPNNWTFIIEAHYAANNRYITKVKTTTTEHHGNIIVTGVDGISNDDTPLQVYPIPATTEITVKAAEAINSIVIYNESGVEVMNIEANGETRTIVNIEDLATGFYFVKVNNQAPVKIVKK